MFEKPKDDNSISRRFFPGPKPPQGSGNLKTELLQGPEGRGTRQAARRARVPGPRAGTRPGARGRDEGGEVRSDAGRPAPPTRAPLARSREGRIKGRPEADGGSARQGGRRREEGREAPAGRPDPPAVRTPLTRTRALSSRSSSPPRRRRPAAGGGAAARDARSLRPPRPTTRPGCDWAPPVTWPRGSGAAPRHVARGGGARPWCGGVFGSPPGGGGRRAGLSRTRRAHSEGGSEEGG